MINRASIYRVLVLCLSVVAAIFLGRYIERVSMVDSRLNFDSPHFRGGRTKIGQIAELIGSRYIDSLDIDQISEELIPLFIKKLDPHSSYLTSEEMERVIAPLHGQFEGVGITFNMMTDTIVVLNVIQNGPSFKAGVIARDRVLTIDGRNVAGVRFPQDSVTTLLRGVGGTKVMVGVQRSGIDTLMQIEIERGKIPVHSVTSAFMIADTVAFIKLAQFSRTTYHEVVSHLGYLKSLGMKSLILDLRGNAGGYLDQAIMLTNEFLKGEQLIVYTEDREGAQRKQWSDGKGAYSDLELVVLIDEQSASASEIFAGAVQDNDQGTIVGRRSFGKGLVQQQFSFKDGSALRLTIAKYYTPLGRSIQRAYTVGDNQSYYNRAERTRRIGEEEEVVLSDSITYVTPKGKVLYGGGGINPDVYVEVDRTPLTMFHSTVLLRNILLMYTTEYADKNAKALSEITCSWDLNNLIDRQGNLVDDFVKYAKGKGVAAPPSEVEESRTLLDIQLRAYIGRNSSLQDNGFYAYSRLIDDVIKQALSTITHSKVEFAPISPAKK